MKTCKDCVCYYDCLHSVEGLKSRNPDTCEYNDLNEDIQNKKEFIKEVMSGIERKKSLKDFFDDLESYKQFRNDVDNCLLYMDFNKIHRTMKMLHWTWCSWIDSDFNDHSGSVPSAFGIRENVKSKIEEMEKWINENPTESHYNTSSGGIEIDMHMVCDPDEKDDYEGQVRFSVKFVLEEFDNGM